MNERAISIAQEHIQQANPSLWNGLSEQPIDFDSRIITYPIDGDTELDISFEYEKEDGWLHFCELRDKQTGKLLDFLHGYGIDSPQNLADTIEDICYGRLPTEPNFMPVHKRKWIRPGMNKFWRLMQWIKSKS